MPKIKDRRMLGHLVKKYRLKAGLTQPELGRCFFPPKNQGHIFRVENDGLNAQVLDFAEILGVDPYTLTGKPLNPARAKKPVNVKEGESKKTGCQFTLLNPCKVPATVSISINTLPFNLCRDHAAEVLTQETKEKGKGKRK